MVQGELIVPGRVGGALPHLLLSTPAKVVALQATAFFPTGFSFKVSFHSIHLTG